MKLGPDCRRSIAALGLTGAFMLAGCSDADESEKNTPNSIVEPSVEVPSSSPTNQSESDMPPDVTASGVVLAATLIAAGNIEDAVASGLVTPAEVDEARDAIESGTLDRWVALAEGR